MGSVKFKAKLDLKTLREAKCSQEEMANLIAAESGRSIVRSLYGNIENGIRPASTDIALTIARILGVEVTEIFVSGNKEKGEVNG